MFRTVPLSIIRSISLYTQQWYMSHTGLLTACEQDQDGTYRFADSLLASCQQTCMTYTIAVCAVMMDRGTVRNM